MSVRAGAPPSARRRIWRGSGANTVTTTPTPAAVAASKTASPRPGTSGREASLTAVAVSGPIASASIVRRAPAPPRRAWERRADRERDDAAQRSAVARRLPRARLEHRRFSARGGPARRRASVSSRPHGSPRTSVGWASPLCYIPRSDGVHGPRSQIPSADLRRPRRPGARDADALQRDPHRACGARVPLHRRARRRQDDDGADRGQGAQLRKGPDPRALRRVRSLPRHHRRPRHGRAGDGRRLEQQRRGRAPAPGVHPLSAQPRPLQDRDRRRGPHAVHGRVQRVPEDAGGAAAAREVHLRHDGGAQGPGHHPLALPALRLPDDPAGRGDAAGAGDPRVGGHRGRRRGGGDRGPRGGRLDARRAHAARSDRGLRRRAVGGRRGRARARHRRPRRAAPGGQGRTGRGRRRRPARGGRDRRSRARHAALLPAAARDDPRHGRAADLRRRHRSVGAGRRGASARARGGGAHRSARAPARVQRDGQGGRGRGRFRHAADDAGDGAGAAGHAPAPPAAGGADRAARRARAARRRRWRRRSAPRPRRRRRTSSARRRSARRQRRGDERPHGIRSRRREA